MDRYDTLLISSSSQENRQLLRGKVSPCEDCPSRNIRQDKNASGIVKVERTDTSLLAEAALIQWEGRDACMMICR